MSTHSRTFLLVAAGAAVALTGAGAAGAGTGKASAERRLTIFYTAEVHGTLEPCGCTSDPLGDVSRYAALVRAAAKAGPTLLVDGGGLSFPESSNPRERGANELRARFLARTMEQLGPFAAGLAETDLPPASAHGAVVPARLAVNLTKTAAVAPSRLETVGGVRVGVFGVADPALAARLGAEGEDPVPAAKREVARLRGAGAELVIALAPLDRPTARRLARAAGPDLVVLGRQVGKGQPRAEAVGNSFLVAASDELQRVGRIDVVWRGAGPLADAGGPEAAALRRIELDAQLSRLDADLARWSAASGSDPAFVAGKRRERADLQKERAELQRPWSPPAAGSYFTNQLIPLRRSLPRDEKTAAEMRRLDGQIGALNLKTAAPPVAAEPGRASYVGDAKCGACHAPALKFWNQTVHATAWRTLVEVNKQNDYRCVGCHVTGYGQVGGSSLGHTTHLRDVQCEVCHGPGSIHVAEKGLEEPSSVRRDTPATVCTGCHTEQHSDTFQYEAYLRDVLGAGHGAAARAKLGDGVTGHELRSAALARAKAAGAAQAGKL